MDENLQVVPAIAKSWTISEDGKTYTFILRNDVRFHDTEFFPFDKPRYVTAAAPPFWIFSSPKTITLCLLRRW